MTVSDQELPSVGFIGVGAIGRPMAERMLRHFPLTICDCDVAARSHFVGKAPFVSSARELAEVADIVFACLPSLESYRAVVLAPGGLSAGGRMRFFIHVGTTGTELVRDIDAALVDRGVEPIRELF